MKKRFMKESIKPSEELENIKKELEPEFFCAYYLNEIFSKYVSEDNIKGFLEKFKLDLEEAMQKEGVTVACFHDTLTSFGG